MQSIIPRRELAARESEGSSLVCPQHWVCLWGVPGRPLSPRSGHRQPGADQESHMSASPARKGSSKISDQMGRFLNGC